MWPGSGIRWSNGWFRGLGVFLEREQRPGPELIEVLLEHAKSTGVQFVDAACAVGLVSNQLRRLEDAEVLRHGGSGDVELVRQFADGKRSFQEEPGQDGAAGTVAQRIELRVFVSSH